MILSTRTTSGKYSPTATKKSFVESITGVASPVAVEYAYVAIPNPVPMIAFFSSFLPSGATVSPDRNLCQIPIVDQPNPATIAERMTGRTVSSLIVIVTKIPNYLSLFKIIFFCAQWA